VIGTREEWLQARRELLEEEKELTRRSDALAAEGCEGCTFSGDQMGRAAPYLNRRDTTFVFASRSPVPVLQAYAEHYGWTIPWVSSGGTSFNDDCGTDALNPAWQLLDRTALGRRDELGLHKRDEVTSA
jgi:predicted dithiol-disulfide oxidoreductase (DUF899 family)